MASKNTDLETEELSEIIDNKKINNDENSISSDSGMSVEKEERQHHRLPKNAQSTNFKALLPDTPGEMLCFDRAEFVRLDFCVDEFVAECRKRVDLEQLRTDLEKYFKRLKGAMIDLINKDYHEFVSLSAHLADLDKQLASLSKPLADISNDTSESRQSLDTELASLVKLLKSRNEESTRSRLIQNAIAVINRLETAENSFAKFKENTDNPKLLEKTVDQFNITKHHAEETKCFPTTVQAKDRITVLETELIIVTERELINTLKQANAQSRQLSSQGKGGNQIEPDLVQKIHILLTSAMLMDNVDRIEKIVQQQLVADAVKKLIEDFKSTGKFLSLKLSELSKFFKSLLSLFEEPCGLLIEIVSGRHQLVGGISGYDFSVKSIWPEIVDQIQSNMPHLFMVTHLEDFLQRYKLARTFMRDFEMRCGSQSSVKRLRESGKMISFNSSWPLVVYFKKVQNVHAERFEDNLTSSCTYQTVLSSIEALFDEKVFIDRLHPRFWRLAMQFLTFYLATMVKQFKQLGNKEVTSSIITQTDEPQANSASLTSQQQYYISELNSLANQLQSLEDTHLITKIPESEHSSLKNTIIQHTPQTTKNSKSSSYKASLKNSDPTASQSSLSSSSSNCTIFFQSVTVQIDTEKSSFIKTLETTISELCLTQLNKAKDVPRLYRRTNRDSPKETSSYIQASFIPLDELNNNKDIPDDLKSQLASFCAVSTAPKFKDIVNGVLDNVKKMEDSLAKFKKKKKPVKDINKSSDDDNIRLQLKLDLEFFVEKYRADYRVSAEISKEASLELESIKEIVESIETQLAEKEANNLDAS